MKAGAAYTGLDCIFPGERIREILSDRAAVAFVTDARGIDFGTRRSRGGARRPPTIRLSRKRGWLRASGATVVVPAGETARLGPDLVAWLQRERIAMFCPPPTLLPKRRKE